MFLFVFFLLNTGVFVEGLNDTEPRVEFSWSAWSNYTTCSVSCGVGQRARNRTCLPNQNLTIDCNDNTTCSDNSTTNGTSTPPATTTCNGTSYNKNTTLPEQCPGSDIEITWCNEGPCSALNGSWSEWSTFTVCSKSCGGGLQTRTRVCDDPSPEYGGVDCDGDSIDVIQCHPEDCPGWSNKGKEFVFGFIPNYRGLYITSLILFVTTEEIQGTKVNVTLPLYSSFSTSFVVRKGQLQKVPIDSNIAAEDGIENKGILVQSDNDIVVYAVNRKHRSSDAFIVLPTAALGQEYYVIAWEFQSTFMIIGTQNNTEINIKFGQQAQTVSILGINRDPGDSFTTHINKFQTLYITSYNGDFTGTHIYSNKPVTLLGGSVCAKIGHGFRDHLVQQLLPIEKWGKDFVTLSMPNCLSDDTFKIVASQPNTVVTVTSESTYTISRPGDFIILNLEDSASTTISSDKPISVALFANGGCGTVYSGDPAMIIIPAIQQYSSDYTFSTVALDGKEFENSVTLIIADSYTNGLRLDNDTLPNTTWKEILGRPDIKYTDFKVSVGVHTVHHVDPEVTFLAVSTGIQEANSYGYPAGISFKHSMSNCTTGLGKNTTDEKIHKNAVSDLYHSLPIDPCKDVICLNNGTCKPRGWTNFECVCQETFAGPLCEINLCKPFPTDVVFLIDSSKSMGDMYFDLQKQFISNITEDWVFDEDHFQIAVITFTSSPKLVYNFNDILNATDFLEKIEKLTRKDGTSDLYSGLKDSESFLNSRNRRVSLTKVRKYLIVLSDGLTYPMKNLTIDNKDIEVRVVAVGEDVSHHFLRSISGSENLFPLDSAMFTQQLQFELIHPSCSGCDKRHDTDLLIAVDVSTDMDDTDLRTVVPSIMSKLLGRISSEELPDVRLSLVTFNDRVQVRFSNKTYSNETRNQLERLSSIFPEPQGKVKNFTNVLNNLTDISINESFGARISAKKVILIISQFKFYVNRNEVAISLVNDIDVFTIGLNFQDDAFNHMTFLAGSPFFVGSVGSIFADQVDDFLDVFVHQLSYVKCTSS